MWIGDSLSEGFKIHSTAQKYRFHSINMRVIIATHAILVFQYHATTVLDLCIQPVLSPSLHVQGANCELQRRHDFVCYFV